MKRLLSYLLLPFPFAVLLIAAGILVLWFTKRQRLGKILVTAGAGALLFFSCGAFAGSYLRPLTQFKPLKSLADAPGVRWIVVLGSGYSDGSEIPALSRLDPAGLQRLIEGVRLYRTQPGTKLILSGGVATGHVSQGEVLAQAAETLGVPRSDLVVEGHSTDTQDEAVMIRDIVQQDRFALVTSRLHMRRSMKLFQKQNLNPIAAPAGYWPAGWPVIPTSGQLAWADAADHEYVGMLWSLLRGTL